MESKERYEYLGSRNTQHLISVASILCLLFGISAISIFTYNPVGVSFTSSIGLWLLSLGVSVRSRFFHKNYTSNQSNPWISGLLLSIAQFFASIASFYDPTNHGSVTTVLGLSIDPPYLSVPATQLRALHWSIFRCRRIWITLLPQQRGLDTVQCVLFTGIRSGSQYLVGAAQNYQKDREYFYCHQCGFVCEFCLFCVYDRSGDLSAE